VEAVFATSAACCLALSILVALSVGWISSSRVRLGGSMKLIPLAVISATMCVCAAAASFAQNGPTLAETLNFIRDRISQEGRVDFTSVVHDSSNNSSWHNSFTIETSNVAADAAKCRITYHEKRITNGQQVLDGDAAVEFDDALGVGVSNMEASIQSADASSGHPTWRSTISPAMWVVTVRYARDEAVFDVSDKSVADGIATAARHAMQLCGGKGHAG